MKSKYTEVGHLKKSLKNYFVYNQLLRLNTQKKCFLILKYAKYFIKLIIHLFRIWMPQIENANECVPSH